jgi:hypothetical protein
VQNGGTFIGERQPAGVVGKGRSDNVRPIAISRDALKSPIRSLWIIHSCELINSAEWPRDHSCLAKVAGGCLHNQSAVKSGVEYVQAAQSQNNSWFDDGFLRLLYMRKAAL